QRESAHAWRRPALHEVRDRALRHLRIPGRIRANGAERLRAAVVHAVALDHAQRALIDAPGAARARAARARAARRGRHGRSGGGRAGSAAGPGPAAIPVDEDIAAAGKGTQGKQRAGEKDNTRTHSTTCTPAWTVRAAPSRAAPAHCGGVELAGSRMEAQGRS